MSYASIVAKGGPQDPHDAAAPQLPTIIPEESAHHDLVDVDSGVSVVSSDFRDQEIKTETQAERLQLEEVAREEEAARAAAKESAKHKEERAEEKAKEVKEKAKAKGKSAANKAEQYVQDPVKATNAVLSTVLAVTLGVQGWKKYKAGELTWKLVGIWTGVVVGFSVVDFYATQWAEKFYQKKKQEK